MSLIITRRAGASTLAAALLAALLVPLAGTGSAAAATATATTPTTVSADALPTVQVNGVVWSQVVVGNRVYATGDFTSARPAGAAAGTSETPRSNILAYDITTGALITSWAPSLNGQGLVVKASPDGKRIYVGGSFTTVSGTSRAYLAALDATTGAVVTGFNPRINSRVRALEAVGSTVYAGGAFNAVAGTARSRLAAVDATTGALLAWNPSADNEPYAMVAVPGLNELVVGGRFSTLNGEQNLGMGALDLTTGATLPWAADTHIHNYGNNSAIYSLTTDGTKVYGTAYDYYGTSGGFESAFAADPAGGAIVWVNGCLGDTYSNVPVAGVLYTAGHAHNCSMQGGHPQTEPWTFQRAQAFDAAGGTTNTSGLSAGWPAASILSWNPTFSPGTFTGQSQAAWSVAANAGYVVYAGEFPRVNGTAQQGLVRFAVRSAAPNKQGPQGYAELTPTLVGTGPGTVRAGFTAAWDRDDATLTYELVRGTAANAPVVDRITATSSWWARPTLALRDTTAAGGSTQTYRIRVTDPSGNALPGATATTTVPAGSGTPSGYAAAVAADAPTHSWRLGEASGTTAYDGAGASDLVLDAGAVRGAEGAVPGGDSATGLTGGGAVPGTTTISETSPAVFSLEAWVRTTSTTGGEVASFGSSSTGASGSYDRMIYLGDDGRARFGIYTGATNVLTSPDAVNDGQWHHLLATAGAAGTVLYVDGVPVAKDTATGPGLPYTGFWRLGGDNLNGWPDRPSTTALTGTVDEVAVYPTALTRERAAAHYSASGRTPQVVAAPADAYGAAVWADGADSFYRFERSTGTTTPDSSETNRAATLVGGARPGAAGAAGSTGLLFDGVDDQVVSPVRRTAPSQYSTELWFSTTTTRGGKLIGFGDSTGGLSSNYDRHVWMLDDGRISFGTWTGQTNVVTSAKSYNDGALHQVVATQGAAGMVLYVDGVAVGTDPQTQAQPYTGSWRVGGDVVWSGSSHYFAGMIDEVATYPTALTAATVGRHWTLGGGKAPDVAPTASFTAAATDLSVAVDSSASRDGADPVVSSAWTFGDGASATGTTASHTYAAAGTYTVTLTVTDDEGDGATTTRDVTVTAPVVPNAVPVARAVVRVTDLAVTADGSTSSDSDGTVASYAWDFGDGATATGATASHTYATAGAKKVTLTVTDDRGATATTSQDVTVTAPVVPNAPPVARAVVRVTDLAVTADGSTSTDSDGTVASYAWDFGDGATATGATASHTYATAGAKKVTLTVTDDRGATATTTQDVTVTAPVVVPPVVTALAADTFTRTTTGGLGQAETGGTWTTTNGAATSLSVDGAAGVLTLPRAGATVGAALAGVSSNATDLALSFSTDKAATGGGTYVYATARRTDAGDYRARVRQLADGRTVIALVKVVGGTETALTGEVAVPGASAAPGAVLRLRVQVTGTGTTTLRARAWAPGTAEPTTWQREVTDATAGLQVAGSIAVSGYLSGSATGVPLALRIDDLAAAKL